MVSHGGVVVVGFFGGGFFVFFLPLYVVVSVACVGIVIQPLVVGL
jgi:hypothetical protein